MTRGSISRVREFPLYKFIVSGLAITGALVPAVEAVAQTTPRTFPFTVHAFRLGKLKQIRNFDGKIEESSTLQTFDRTPKGRVITTRFSLCRNMREIPALFEGISGKESSLALTYDPLPQSGKFRCVEEITGVSQMEYKASVGAEGDVYTFNSEFTERRNAKGGTKYLNHYTERAVIRFTEDACTVISYRFVHEDEAHYPVVDYHPKITTTVTSDDNSNCRFLPDRDKHHSFKYR